MSSAQNPRLKRLKKLLTHRQSRYEESVFVVEGPTLVAEALSSARTVTEIYLDEALVAADLELAAAEAGVPVTRVAPGVLAKVLSTSSPQPAAAVVTMTVTGWDDVPAGSAVLVAVDAQDPGNVGTLCRTAEASGCGALVLAGASVDPTNPKVVRSAAGSSLRLPVISSPDPLTVFEQLRASGHSVVAAVVGSGVAHDEADLASAAIVLGNEANGLPPELVDAADEAVSIELAGPTESLNVAAAGAVLCFESLKQRRAVGAPAHRSPQESS